MEPRARAGRHKSTLNFGDDLRNVLVAYGAPTHPDLVATTTHPDSAIYLNLHDNPRVSHNGTSTTQRPTPFSGPSGFPQPYPETLRVLDEILTDFIIETCHGAVRHATLAGRTKINNKDFEFVIRRDSKKMGRVQDLMRRQKRLARDRKLVDANGEGGVGGGKLGEDAMVGLAGFAGEDSGTGKGKGRGRGRRKKKDKDKDKKGAEEDVGKENGEIGAVGLVGEDDLDLDGDLNGEGEIDADGEADEDDERPAKRARSDTG